MSVLSKGEFRDIWPHDDQLFGQPDRRRDRACDAYYTLIAMSM